MGLLERSGEPFFKAGKFRKKARKYFPEAEKFSAKFDTFRFKHVMLERERDVNSSLQVKSGGQHDWSAFGPDLRNRDHVTLFNPLLSIQEASNILCKRSLVV